jgi:hypothetical protein
MICKDCRKKPACVRPCEKLKKHLDLVTNYQREKTLEPALLTQLFASGEKSESEEEWDALMDELNLPYLVARLEFRTRVVISGYFWEGKSIPALARRLKISRSRAQRLFEAGIKSLGKAVRRNQKARKRILLTGAKFSYNKKPENEKKQGEKTRKGKTKAAA